MADSSLDDFFAKKDKGKKKTKSKITPSDILAQSTVDQEKRKKKKKDKQASSTASSGTEAENTNKVPKTEDEEWIDYEQEVEKDYTGLRIQNLQISGKEEAEGDEEQENEEGEDGEPRERRDIAAGPWNVEQSQSQPQPVEEKAPPPEEPPQEEPPKTTGKYVPPGARAGSRAAGNALEPVRVGRGVPKKKVGAPNLNSEDDFPTLGGESATSHNSSWNFEKVQSGGKQMEDPSKKNAQLTLGNKYAALQD